MLRRPERATVDEVASATGWQRHTVRGVFSGTLKKKLRLTLASVKEERGRVYRIDGAGHRQRSNSSLTPSPCQSADWWGLGVGNLLSLAELRL